MKLRLETISPSTIIIDQDLRDQLLKLTFTHENGDNIPTGMYEYIVHELLEHRTPWSTRKHDIIIVARDHESRVVVGWCLLRSHKNSFSAHDLQIYVSPTHRRKSIGRRMMAFLDEEHGNKFQGRHRLHTYPDDTRSCRFFSETMAKYNLPEQRCDVFDFWKGLYSR